VYQLTWAPKKTLLPFQKKEDITEKMELAKFKEGIMGAQGTRFQITSMYDASLQLLVTTG
jgi:hypothetical protein